MWPFFQSHIHCLGHLYLPEGILFMSDKLDTIKYVPPTKISENYDIS